MRARGFWKINHNAVAFNAQRSCLGARKSLFSLPRFAYVPVVKTMKALSKPNRSLVSGSKGSDPTIRLGRCADPILKLL